MILKRFFIYGILIIYALSFAPLATFAAATTTAAAGTTRVDANICAQTEDGKKTCADSPSECFTNSKLMRNCLMLEEPIGGKRRYDLFKVSSDGKTKTLWGGEALAPGERVIQVILTWEPGKEYEGPFTLLYNYIGLVYGYMSGVIIGMAVLFVIVGGIQMTTSSGDTTRFDAGKDRILKAIVGLIIWFLASLILYTINPTFYSF